MVDDKEKPVPQIRFRGFTDAWKPRKLGEVAQSVGTGRSAFTSNAEESPDTPFAVLGSTSVISYDREYDHSGDFILTARVGANAGNLYRYQGSVKITDNTVYIQGNNLDYLYYLLLKFDLKSLSFGTGQPLIKASELKSLTLQHPSESEQAVIGSFFSALDHTITLYKRKLDGLKKLKAAYLQQMFPQAGKRAPRIRFEWFAGDWEQRRLSDYLETSKAKNIDGAFDKGDVLSVSGECGVINQIEHKGRSFAGQSVLQYGIVNNGDVVYTKSPLKANPHGIIKTNFGKPGIVSTLYAVYTPKPIACSNFVQWYFELDARLNNYLKPLVNKGAKNDMKVSDDNALKGSVAFPGLPEQTAIGSFFRTLDNAINTQTERLEQAKRLKLAYLQKMFV